MRLEKLKLATGTAGIITVVCAQTGARAIWNDAAAAGWVADLDGKAFNAYYSPAGVEKLKANPQETLFGALRAAGIETANHESDLYFPASPEALAILARFPLQKSIAERFINQAPPNVGETWVDVPFAFQPFWEKVAERSAKMEAK